VGDAGVGKTTFIRRHITGEFRKNYIATLGVDVSPMSFQTSHGLVSLNALDCAGQGRIDHTYCWAGTDACVLMFDVTSSISYRNVAWWYNHVRRLCGPIPIVLCGNKVDCDRKVPPHAITFHQKMHVTREGPIQYYDISAKSNYNFEKPFLWILRQLVSDELTFVEMPIKALAETVESAKAPIRSSSPIEAPKEPKEPKEPKAPEAPEAPKTDIYPHYALETSICRKCENTIKKHELSWRVLTHTFHLVCFKPLISTDHLSYQDARLVEDML